MVEEVRTETKKTYVPHRQTNHNATFPPVITKHTLRIQFSTGDAQLIWPPLCSRLMPADHTWVNVRG